MYLFSLIYYIIQIWLKRVLQVIRTFLGGSNLLIHHAAYRNVCGTKRQGDNFGVPLTQFKHDHASETPVTMS